ncbi:cytochrome d ubiquinol oxidase subunit II [Jeongeupia naejangsanensis]|uniref:Cytochrome d ubiquinol oxidase subunit II n=1 Tax=Jeongeupia naejangsanensis TaxID=613195 RepID=A0ABS2BP63_9NEIS|nr:cytochrome d ubiquinol oxidase subunit II [Jeongeupia naejangsanensis]MBM3116843.1 cytochrome d ubiquinol oxidase subunit II [Jeongeupia naejangsanensis]
MIDITLVWAGIIALGVFIYVMLDGFDLGIGILFPFFPNEADRDVMMNTVAPVWDGNETWLVLGGAGLFAAFPVVYSAVLSALYLPLVLMLVGLIFRGVAFEIRAKATRTRHLWDLAFIAGSVLATFCQGVALGAYIQGIKVVGREFAGGGFDWLSAFSLFTGFGLVATYALLGCGWLIIKTQGELQRRMIVLMSPLTWLLLGAIAVVSVWTPLREPAVAARWFSLPNFFWLAPVPLAVLGCAWGIRRALRQGRDYAPYFLALAIVALGYCGFLISIWPYLIPPAVTLWDAAAPASSQSFTLVGALIIIPVILAYTALGYWVFRGKVRADDAGYH